MRVTDSRQILAVWLIFAVSSLVGTPVPGVNEPHYLSKARSFIDSDWCRRDFFLTSVNAHYCFYSLTGPAAAVLQPGTVAVLGRLVSLLLLAWGWCRLGIACGLTAAGQVMSAGLMLAIAGLGSFSGEWIVGGFESKVPAWGLALASVAFRIRADQGSSPRDALLAGLLAGLAAAFHPVVGLWFILATVVAGGADLSLRMVRRSGSAQAATMPGSGGLNPADKCRWRHGAAPRRGGEIWIYLTGCLVTSLPGLIPAAAMLRQSGITAEQNQLANFVQVFWRLKHHLDPTEFRRAAWIHTLILSLICSLCCGWLVRSKDQPRVMAGCRGIRQLYSLLLVAAGIAAAGVWIGWHAVPAPKMTGWEWRAALLKFYPFRLFDGLLPIATAISGVLLVQSLRSPHLTPTLPTENRRNRKIQCVGFLILTSVVAGTALWNRPEAPGGYTPDQYDDWQKACQWAREHTPADALFLTPRESFGFKWFAERAEFVNYKDCPQDAAGILQWNDRLWYVSGWMQRSSADGRYDREDLRTLHQNTAVDYLVTRIPVVFTDEPLFAGRFWRIYRVPD